MDLRNQIITDHLGKIVHVVVDRPVGYRHGDILYPINYGYIPGVLAGDGEEQDVYILGISEPITEFDGQVVGAVRRKNDRENKLVTGGRPCRNGTASGANCRSCSFSGAVF